MPDCNLETKTGRVYAAAFKILAEHPDGVRWTDLKSMTEKAEPDLHPKTINSCVWRLVEKYPDHVCKPAKGLFRLKKYQEV